MNCPQCGDICHCPSEPCAGLAAELPARSNDVDCVSAPVLIDARESGAGLGEAVSAEATGTAEEDASAWRDELSARLSRYRTRRKAPPPRYPSLALKFDSFDYGSSAQSTASSAPVFESVANQALALDGMRQDLARIEPEVQITSAAESIPPASQARPSASAKIIEFPRFAWSPPPPPPDQLAEPVLDRPRILEVPEVAPPPPALGGITIEAAQREEAEKLPGIDVPLQSASLARRLLAGGIDGLVITSASAVFATIFWKVAGITPPPIQVLGMTVGTLCLLWAAYQYLLVVYSGSTLGLRVAGLELAGFDGTATTRSLRRWRILASYLSAASLGMGYAWVFLDEDVLCWHDRITHTYLAPRKRS